MIELLILLALSWFFRKCFVGASLEDVEGFLICEEVAGEELGNADARTRSTITLRFALRQR